MSKRKLFFASAIIVLVALWAAFRPERLFVNARVDESLPMTNANTPMANTSLASGTFHSVAHKTEGSASILQMADGSRVLRFTNFATSNGPDVRVYLVAANDASDSDTVTKSGFVEIGALKGNIGNQNYELPSSVDLAKYRAVTIWCKRFSVNFATAPLTATQPMAALGY
jgi:hypothetical protein